MKDAIRKKLNSSRGASILMALLLLLVAVMVSAVILAAALSAAKTIRTDREQQQTYLTVSSAAELVRDSILNGSGGFKLSKTTVQTNTETRACTSWDYRGPNFSNWEVSSEGESPWTLTSEPATGDFSTLMNTAIESVMKNSQPYESEFTIESADGEYETVAADMSLKREKSEYKEENGSSTIIYYYVLTVTFTGGEDDHKCKMTLEMNGREKVDNSTPKTDEQITEYYSYKNGGGKTKTTNDGIKKIVTTTTTSIDWTQSSPTITRERAVSK